MEFVGRDSELQYLKRFIDKRSASLIVVKGRRRIGKSRLVEEFATKNNIKLISFAGLPPEKGITAQTQRDEFSRVLKIKNKTIDDWAELFEKLFEKTAKGKVLILLDEISWMAHDDPTFKGKLKNAWDLLFKKNPNLILILCGSVSSWIEKNILFSTGFVGRISYVLNLKELSLNECNKFWNNSSGYISAFEKIKTLCITGGIPRYLEEINPTVDANRNILDLCFRSGGLLYEEFDRIFHDIFTNRNSIYKSILENIVNEKLSFDQICKKIDLEKSGVISEYLHDLETAGFIEKDYTWKFSTGKKSKTCKYRIKDNYVRFYLKYIDPNKDIIKRGGFEKRSLTSLPAWQTIMGFQFENLVLSNRNEIFKVLQISVDDIVYDNPYFQKNTKRSDSCQIDYLIQTRFDTLYVCEIKFSKNLIRADIVKEMKEKISKLKIPRHTSCRAVLIHVNGVTEDLLDTRYFANIIDFSSLLK
jgi:uncharacterized protein